MGSDIENGGLFVIGREAGVSVGIRWHTGCNRRARPKREGPPRVYFRSVSSRETRTASLDQQWTLSAACRARCAHGCYAFPPATSLSHAYAWGQVGTNGLLHGCPLWHN